jgi:hypothetical protein
MGDERQPAQQFRYLSPEWFESAVEHTPRELDERPGLSCRLQFVASGEQEVIWTQVISDGRVVEWRLGPCPNADVEVHLTLEHAWRVWCGDVDGNEALAGMTIVEDRATGRWTGPPAPMDLDEQPELRDLPVFPGACLEVEYEYGRAPFGPVTFGLSIIDGQMDAMSLGGLSSPDVRAQGTFMQMALIRRGQMSMLDALMAGAKVAGEEGALALLLGVAESPEYKAAQQACGVSGYALAVLGEVSSDRAYGDAMAALAEVTLPPAGL